MQLTMYSIVSRAYEEKRACNSQCILCMRHITDESAGYTIFSQLPTREIDSIRQKNGLGLRLDSEHPVHKVHVQ